MTKDFLVGLIILSLALVFLGGVGVTVATITQDPTFLVGGFASTALGAGFLAIVYGTLLRGYLTHPQQSATKESHG